MNEKIVRERIVKARELAGYTIAEAARLIKCDRTSLTRKESGERRIYVEDLIGFVEIYQKPIEYFFTTLEK